MDEAVAGHANRIEVELHADGSLTVRDNGRGMPVDPHPKFPDKSALEVILCTLHSGGKFSGKAYETSGGLHGVGVSVVNALSDRLAVEVARNRQLYRQDFSRGLPQGPLQTLGPDAEPARHHRHLPPRPEIFGADAHFKPARLLPHGALQGLSLLRRRNPLEMRRRLPRVRRRHAREATFHFPGGLADYLAERLDGAQCYADRPFAGKVDFAERFGAGTVGSVEWAINWTPQRDGFVSSYCNTIPPPRAARTSRASGRRS